MIDPLVLQFFFEKLAEEYRPRVSAIVHKEIKGQPHVLVAAPSSGMPSGSSRYSFPGGGIEEGQSAHQAAQMELMEEAGVKGKNFKTYGQPLKMDLDENWRKRQFNKRGKYYSGVHNQTVIGEYHGDDASLHGTAGDAWDFEWVPVDTVQKELEGDYSQFREDNLRSVEALKHIKQTHYKRAAWLVDYLVGL